MSAPDAPSITPPVPAGVALLFAAAGVVLDQATKLLAERTLVRGVFVPWLGDGVGWQLVYNPGAAFGLPAPPWLFLLVTTIVVVIVVRALPHTRTFAQAGAYGLLLSGALGNLLDRILRADDGPLSGEVVDFVAWGSFPRFNVADSWITIGFALLVLALWIEEREASDVEDEAGAVEGGAGGVLGTATASAARVEDAEGEALEPWRSGDGDDAAPR